MRTVMKTVVAMLPILALASFALVQQASTTVQPAGTMHARADIQATQVDLRN
jgi:hypothetical protein